MSGETGHLQRLTDEQVKARIASYGDDGRFEASLRQLWNDAGPVIEAAVRTHFGEDVGCLGAKHFAQPIDEAWVRSVLLLTRPRACRCSCCRPAFVT